MKDEVYQIAQKTIEIAARTQAIELDFTEQKLTELPSEIGKLQNLEHLLLVIIN